jgi:hypothetical protein
MKSFFTLIFIMLVAFPVLSQDTDSYYNPVIPQTQGRKPPSIESVLSHYGPVRIQNRWYVGVDGFIRNDRATISNTFDGLIDTKSISKFGWGAVAGWVYKEDWAIEAAYARSPIHNTLIVSSTYPLEFHMQNDKNSLTIRGKRRLLFGKSTIRKSSFWIGVGLSAVPNSGKEKEFIDLAGYARQGRLPVYDTLRLQSLTRINKKITGAVDVSLEYIISAGRAMEVSIYGRNQWGLGNSITTSVNYTVNRQDMGTALIKGDGSGWLFGLSLRYIFHTDYDFDDFNRLYNLKRK